MNTEKRPVLCTTLYRKSMQPNNFDGILYQLRHWIFSHGFHQKIRFKRNFKGSSQNFARRGQTKELLDRGEGVWTCFVVRSTVKKKNCDRQRVALRCLHSQISKKKCTESLPDLQGGRYRDLRMRKRLIGTQQILKALALAPVQHRAASTTAIHFWACRKEKKRRNRVLLRLFEIASLFISQWTLDLQASVPARVRQMKLLSSLWRRTRIALKAFDQFWAFRERRC